MTAPRRRTVFGVLGTTLDVGTEGRRWERWRPTVALCQHDNLLVDRLELIHDRQHTTLAGQIADDIASVSPETELRCTVIDLKDPWDFEEVYGALHDFVRGYPFDVEAEDYLVNITTGTHVAQICWFLLVEARYMPAKLLQLTPPKRWKDRGPGKFGIIDLDLSRYDRIATRFKAEQAEDASFLKSGIATRNPAFNRVIDRIEQVAIRSRAPLLLTGPTGAGKLPACPEDFRVEKAAPADAGRLCRGELRDAARRWCHVGAVRPQEGRLHRGRIGSAGTAARSQWRNAVS